MFPVDKHYILLQIFVNYNHKKLITIGQGQVLQNLYFMK
jgi:hypothetical protein